MKKICSSIAILLVFSILMPASILAQTAHNYTDHKPQYRKWLDSYILDKIEYKPTSTVFYFRFVCDNEKSGGATFYPPGGESPWYLKGRDVKKEVDITAVKNVRVDGVLIKADVSKEAFHADPPSKVGHSIFSCEVHFPRLDDDMKEADLIEAHTMVDLSASYQAMSALLLYSTIDNIFDEIWAAFTTTTGFKNSNSASMAPLKSAFHCTEISTLSIFTKGISISFSN